MIVADPIATCRACEKPFTRYRSTQVACSPRCARKVVEAKDKQERAEFRKRKEAVKPRAKWLAEAQQAVNAWVRFRDRDLPCISCSRFHDGKYDAGHYLSRGSHPELRFDLRNIHKQCVPCNRHQHGNVAAFRMNLVQRHGIETVEWLEGPHQTQKYSVDELRCIRDGFRLLLKEGLKDD